MKVKRHINVFLAGVVVVAPFAVTAYLLWLTASVTDRIMRSVLGLVHVPMPSWVTTPGAGVVAGLILIYLIGLLTRLYAFRLGLRMLEGLMLRVPVIKSVFEAIRDVMRLFAGDPTNMGQVVRVKLPCSEVYMLGVLTNRHPRGAAGLDKVAVFVPMSYQMGGFTIYVDAKDIELLDIPVQDALKIAATAEAGTESDPLDKKSAT
jgi:uncharacterized membrane protein